MPETSGDETDGFILLMIRTCDDQVKQNLRGAEKFIVPFSFKITRAMRASARRALTVPGNDAP